MIHPNARLTPITRRELVKMVARGWSQAETARQFRVSRATVSKWVGRYRREGWAGVLDHPCRPRRSPKQTSAEAVEAICALRQGSGWGPHRLGWALGIARSTVYAVLRRAGLHRLAWLHRATRQVVRYEHAQAGDLVHLDVKKIGRIPPGGGKRFAPGFQETQSGPKHHKRVGVDYLHVAVDDHSRYAYVEVLPNEQGATTAGFLERTLAHLNTLGVHVQRILTDNGGNYRSHAFREVIQAHQLAHKRTRPFRPQTNGKAEAFNKILQAEWAYLRPFTTNEERLAELDPYLVYYNRHRPHGGIAGAVPYSRLSTCQ